MITKSQLLDAIATAILNKQYLYIDTFDPSAATPSDFCYCAPYDSPEGVDLLFTPDEFIDDAIIGENNCEIYDCISALEIKHGWDGDADMPSWEQIRDYVSACDTNDNFNYTVECLKSEGFMEG